MCNTCSGSSGCESSTTCVSKEIQYFDRSSCISDLLREPVPVRCLLREKAGVFEAERFQAEGQVFIVDLPLLRQMEKLPFSAALAASVIMAVFLFPARIFFFRVPDDLRVWSYQKVISPPLQFLSAGRIQHFIIFPSICYPHFIGFLSLLSQNLSCSELYVPMIP